MILASKDRKLKDLLDDHEVAAQMVAAAFTVHEGTKAVKELRKIRRAVIARVQELVNKQLSAYDAALIANYDGKN